MHILFSDEEKKWIELRVLGWPIKKNCPDKIRRSIEAKKKEIERQKDIVYG